jgi:poly(ribitol-phosphate) beta-N-acetylglucosaminyltransferase
MPVKVSVVVPVYNPGRHIDRLFASLRRQSLATEQFEVIFVDDGSTDGTAERLDALAAEVPNFRVIHIPPSGWPGRPRNVGVAAARGEYVQFVDNDDELGDEALERLWNYAKANDSDVVVGREVRRNTTRSVSALFAVNRPSATLGTDPLLTVLTPHKMFRREFLVQHRVRFPEGPRRLEDHPFVMEAYFRADVISVLSDYPCYYWVTRDDGSNTGRRRRNWSEWYGYLRDTLDVVEAHTDPGPFRDRLLSHWYRTKGLGLLGSPLARREEADARALMEALADLAADRFPPSVDDHLPPIMRVRSALLRGGQLDRIRSLAVAERGMRLEESVRRLRAVDGGLDIEVTAELVYADRSPVKVRLDEGRAVWVPPIPLGEAVPGEALDFTSHASRPQLDVLVRRRSTHELYALPGATEPLPVEPDGSMRLGATRRVRLDPETLQAGRPLEVGTWDLRVQLSSCGWHLQSAVRTPSDRKAWPASTALATPRTVVPISTARGTVALHVTTPRLPRPLAAVRARARALRRRATRRG